MYHFKITTPSKIEYYGVSSNIQDLQYLINKKFYHSNTNGRVDIFEGKKSIASYLEK